MGSLPRVENVLRFVLHPRLDINAEFGALKNEGGRYLKTALTVACSLGNKTRN
jgi:hypothetical protein